MWVQVTPEGLHFSAPLKLPHYGTIISIAIISIIIVVVVVVVTYRLLQYLMIHTLYLAIQLLVLAASLLS